MSTRRQWAVAAARVVAAPSVGAVGELGLAEFQAHAATRLAAMIREWGGALLADAVGLGKTRVALTVAATLAREQRIAGAQGEICCCVPSRLASNWRMAARAAGLTVRVVTHAQMSRGVAPPARPLLIVVDEAHRFRNRDTARRRTLAQLADVPMLLVTATPVANSIDDLWSLLELFLDDDDVRFSVGWDLATARRMAQRGAWDPVELVREVTVRRTAPPDASDFGRRPSVALEVVGYTPSADEAWLWSNLEAEVRALRLFDGDDWPKGLFVEHLLRRWESGPDALLETVEDLRAYAERRLDAGRQGRSLDRASFRELFGSEPDQEVFGFLYPEGDPGAVDALGDDIDRLLNLGDRARRVCDGGLGRDDVVLRLAARVDRLLVFTSYRRAAEGLFARLTAEMGPTARVGLVTGSRAEATGLGRVRAEEILRRFSPRSHDASYRPHEQLQTLVATDCIAEGVNLQDCGHIVLADLPYTPLGIEQRVGRLVRPGGGHTEVRVYLPRPENWNDSLGMRRRLQTKLRAAHDVGFGDAPAGPLAALTLLEQIALADAEAVELPRAAKLCEDPATWLVLARVGDRPWFFALGDGRTFVEAVSELVWDERELDVCEPPQVVLDALARRETFLRGALQAPAALGLDEPEAQAWRVLLTAASELGLGPSDLAELRERLLYRHRLGVRRRLVQLVETGSPARLLRYVQQFRAPSSDATVTLVATLGLPQSWS